MKRDYITPEIDQVDQHTDSDIQAVIDDTVVHYMGELMSIIDQCKNTPCPWITLFAFHINLAVADIDDVNMHQALMYLSRPTSDDKDEYIAKIDTETAPGLNDMRAHIITDFNNVINLTSVDEIEIAITTLADQLTSFHLNSCADFTRGLILDIGCRS